MPWCRFFVPKIASPDVKQDDPAFNDHVMYAKCVKGHVLKDANDWILCENLPDPYARCWQEGGETLFSLRYKQQEAAAQAENGQPQAEASAPAQRATS